jgi:heme-degrading monooxygenase HmoA
MPFVLIIHEVEDYPAWKAIFDGAADLRRAAGELSFQVLCEEAHANRVVHFSRWRDLASARAFFESDDLVEIRRQAGVRQPRFLYLEELDSGEL